MLELLRLITLVIFITHVYAGTLRHAFEFEFGLDDSVGTASILNAGQISTDEGRATFSPNEGPRISIPFASEWTLATGPTPTYTIDVLFRLNHPFVGNPNANHGKVLDTHNLDGTGNGLSLDRAGRYYFNRYNGNVYMAPINLARDTFEHWVLVYDGATSRVRLYREARVGHWSLWMNETAPANGFYDGIGSYYDLTFFQWDLATAGGWQLDIGVEFMEHVRVYEGVELPQGVILACGDGVCDPEALETRASCPLDCFHTEAEEMIAPTLRHHFDFGDTNAYAPYDDLVGNAYIRDNSSFSTVGDGYITFPTYEGPHIAIPFDEWSFYGNTRSPAYTIDLLFRHNNMDRGTNRHLSVIKADNASTVGGVSVYNGDYALGCCGAVYSEPAGSVAAERENLLSDSIEHIILTYSNVTNRMRLYRELYPSVFALEHELEREMSSTFVHWGHDFHDLVLFGIAEQPLEIHWLDDVKIYEGLAPPTNFRSCGDDQCDWHFSEHRSTSPFYCPADCDVEETDSNDLPVGEPVLRHRFDLASSMVDQVGNAYFRNNETAIVSPSGDGIVPVYDVGLFLSIPWHEWAFFGARYQPTAFTIDFSFQRQGQNDPTQFIQFNNQTDCSTIGTQNDRWIYIADCGVGSTAEVFFRTNRVYGEHFRIMRHRYGNFARTRIYRKMYDNHWALLVDRDASDVWSRRLDHLAYYEWRFFTSRITVSSWHHLDIYEGLLELSGTGSERLIYCGDGECDRELGEHALSVPTRYCPIDCDGVVQGEEPQFAPILRHSFTFDTAQPMNDSVGSAYIRDGTGGAPSADGRLVFAKNNGPIIEIPFDREWSFYSHSRSPSYTIALRFKTRQMGQTGNNYAPIIDVANFRSANGFGVRNFHIQFANHLARTEHWVEDGTVENFIFTFNNVSGRARVYRELWLDHWGLLIEYKEPTDNSDIDIPSDFFYEGSYDPLSVLRVPDTNSAKHIDVEFLDFIDVYEGIMTPPEHKMVYCGDGVCNYEVGEENPANQQDVCMSDCATVEYPFPPILRHRFEFTLSTGFSDSVGNATILNSARGYLDAVNGGYKFDEGEGPVIRLAFPDWDFYGHRMSPAYSIHLMVHIDKYGSTGNNYCQWYNARNGTSSRERGAALTTRNENFYWGSMPGTSPDPFVVASTDMVGDSMFHHMWITYHNVTNRVKVYRELYPRVWALIMETDERLPPRQSFRPYLYNNLYAHGEYFDPRFFTSISGFNRNVTVDHIELLEFYEGIVVPNEVFAYCGDLTCDEALREDVSNCPVDCLIVGERSTDHILRHSFEFDDSLEDSVGSAYIRNRGVMTLDGDGRVTFAPGDGPRIALPFLEEWSFYGSAMAPAFTIDVLAYVADYNTSAYTAWLSFTNDTNWQIVSSDDYRIWLSPSAKSYKENLGRSGSQVRFRVTRSNITHTFKLFYEDFPGNWYKIGERNETDPSNNHNLHRQYTVDYYDFTLWGRAQKWLNVQWVEHIRIWEGLAEPDPSTIRYCGDGICDRIVTDELVNCATDCSRADDQQALVDPQVGLRHSFDFQVSELDLIGNATIVNDYDVFVGTGGLQFDNDNGPVVALPFWDWDFYGNIPSPSYTLDFVVKLESKQQGGDNVFLHFRNETVQQGLTVEGSADQVCWNRMRLNGDDEVNTNLTFTEDTAPDALERYVLYFSHITQRLVMWRQILPAGPFEAFLDAFAPSASLFVSGYGYFTIEFFNKVGPRGGLQVDFMRSLDIYEGLFMPEGMGFCGDGLCDWGDDGGASGCPNDCAAAMTPFVPAPNPTPAPISEVTRRPNPTTTTFSVGTSANPLPGTTAESGGESTTIAGTTGSAGGSSQTQPLATTTDGQTISTTKPPTLFTVHVPTTKGTTTSTSSSASPASSGTQAPSTSSSSGETSTSSSASVESSATMRTGGGGTVGGESHRVGDDMIGGGGFTCPSLACFLSIGMLGVAVLCCTVCIVCYCHARHYQKQRSTVAATKARSTSSERSRSARTSQRSAAGAASTRTSRRVKSRQASSRGVQRQAPDYIELLKMDAGGGGGTAASSAYVSGDLTMTGSVGTTMLQRPGAGVMATDSRSNLYTNAPAPGMSLPAISDYVPVPSSGASEVGTDSEYVNMAVSRAPSEAPSAAYTALSLDSDGTSLAGVLDRDAVESWDVDTFVQFLRTLRLKEEEAVCEVAKQENIDGEVVCAVTIDELFETLGVKATGDRIKLKKRLASVCSAD